MMRTIAYSFAQLTKEGGGLQAQKGPITLPGVWPSGRIRADGAYLHVPFCFHKCHYCDFYSLVDARDRREAFTLRLLAEIDAVGSRQDGPLGTVFVGGGTPTLLRPDQWERILAALRDRLAVTAATEVTVEANPETVTGELAACLAAGGVDRVSIGCQSFEPRHLSTLERWHEPAAVGRSVDRLRAAGVADLNLDLIFGIPGQTLAEWGRDLDTALALEPTHLSCYALTYEQGTAMTARLQAGLVRPIDEELELAMYELAIERLAGAGLEHYEVSAWARPGRRCRHNLLYWNGGDWWALGPAASGHLAGLRWRNLPRLTEYLEQGPWPPITDVEPPDADRAVAEAFLMGLRLREGMPRDRVASLLAATARGADRRDAIERQLERGMLEWTSGPEALRLTHRGLLLADTVIGELL